MGAVAVLWVVGLSLLFISGGEIWRRWQSGDKYRQAKSLIGEDPFAKSVVEASQRFYEVRWQHVYGALVGFIFIILAALGI